MSSAEVGAYLEALPDERRAAMQQIRDAIRRGAPEAEEAISYRMPAFRLGGRFFMSYDAFARHYSVFPASPAVIDRLGAEIAPHVAGKGTLRFDAATAIPVALVERIARIRVAEHGREAAGTGGRRHGRTITVTKPTIAAIVGVFIAVGCASPAPSEPVPPPDGAAPGWTELARSPLEPRHGAYASWSGTELLVVGGDALAPACPFQQHCVPRPRDLRRDGAALDLASGTWRAIADAPIPLVDMVGSVVGGRLYLLVYGANPGAAPAPALLVYDPAADAWRELPAPGATRYGLVAAGTRLVAFHPSQELGVEPDRVFDPGSGAWADLPVDPLAPAFDRDAVWTGADLVVLGIRLDPTRPPNRPPVYGAAAHAIPGGDWRRIPDSEIAGWNPSWHWSGGAIVNASIGGADGGQTNNWGREFPFGGLLTPPAGNWSDLPNPPREDGGLTGMDASGPVHVVSYNGWVLHVPTGRWERLPEPPNGGLEGVAATWAGDRLVVWGGVAWGGRAGTLTDAGWAWGPSR